MVSRAASGAIRQPVIEVHRVVRLVASRERQSVSDCLILGRCNCPRTSVGSWAVSGWQCMDAPLRATWPA